MSTNVTWNGVTYAIPAAGEVGWSALSNFLIALGNDAAIAQEMKQAIRVATATPVTVSNTTDCVVATNLSVAGAVAVTLPAGTDGRWFVIVDQKGDAGTNNITITPNGAETINGSATYVINQASEGVILAYSVTNTRWNIVARFTGGNPLTNPMVTTGDMIYGGASGVVTKLATAATTGLLHGGNGAVPTWSLLVNADVSGSAAIAYSKLNLATSIVNADVSGSAAIAYSKLNLATSIVNADVSASAAIAGSKIVTASGATAGVVDGNSQSFAGAKTFTGGVVFNGGGSNLNYYITGGTFSTSFGNPFNSTQTPTFKYSVIGNIATITLVSVNAAAAGAAPGSTASTANIAAALWPATSKTVGYVLGRNNGALDAATLYRIDITSGGTLSINRPTAWTVTANCGWDNSTVTYNLD